MIYEYGRMTYINKRAYPQVTGISVRKEHITVKITFIGTGAGEAYPGFWCECPNCSYAREKKGRNIRGNTCTMIDDDTMIDMNAHFYEAAPHMGIRMSRIELLLVTHAHADHLTPHLIGQRHIDIQILPPFGTAEIRMRTAFHTYLTYIGLVYRAHIVPQHFLRFAMLPEKRQYIAARPVLQCLLYPLEHIYLPA